MGSELPPPFLLPTALPLPLSKICFLQFVKSVIIFLGAFLLFFKCKIYLYSVFKVVKKKKITTKPNQTNPPEVCLLASCVAITLSALAGFADSLPCVPLTLGGSGAHSGTHAFTHVCTQTWAHCSEGGLCLGVGKSHTAHSAGLGPAAAPDTWNPGLSPVPLTGSGQRWLSPARGSP